MSRTLKSPKAVNARRTQTSRDNGDMNMGDILRARRTAIGLSQAELASVVGVDRRQIRRYEANVAQPTLPVARAMAHRLGITLDELAGDDSADLSGDWLSGWQVQDAGGQWGMRVQPVRAIQRGDRLEISSPVDRTSGPNSFPWHGDLHRSNATAYGSFRAEAVGFPHTRGALVVTISLEPQQITGAWVTVGSMTRPISTAAFAMTRSEPDLAAIITDMATRL